MTADISDLVVEILHYRSDDKNPKWSVGSGFFVGKSRVLTALHNVDGRGELLVRIYGKEEHSATVILPTNKDHKDMDLALLEVSNVTVDVPPLRYGTVDRSTPAEVERCWAIGFPEFKVLEHEHGKPKPPSTTVQINGKIPTCECLGQQRLTLHAEINPRPSSEGSEWAGMSGAVVFSGSDIVVGVITEHHLPEGESALNVVPITAIDNLLPSTEAVKWWQSLGVSRQAFVSLPDMNGSILHENSWSYIKDFKPIIDPKKIFGREKELERIEEILKDESSLVITGLRGTGKSTLASMFVDRMQERKKFDEIYWRRVNETTTVTDIIGSFFTVIGKPVKEMNRYKIQDQINLFFHELNEAFYLLVLDNFETLLDPQTNKPLESKVGFYDLIEKASENCIRSKILFTSWESFASERGIELFSYQIEGLDASAGTLLLKIKKVNEPEDDLKKAVKLAGGNPLALILLAQLVGQRAGKLSVLLNQDSLWIGKVAENILNKVYYKRLSEDERKLLQYVSIYRQPASVNAINAISSDPAWHELKVKKVALSLSHKSLLQTDGDNYWEELLIGRYAAMKLSEKSKCHKLACEHFLSLPKSLNPKNKEDVQFLIEAHYHACMAGEYNTAFNIVFNNNLHEKLDLWGNYTTLVDMYTKMLPEDHPENNNFFENRGNYSKVIGNLGNAYIHLGDTEKAIECYAHALKIAIEIKDRNLEGRWLGNLGNSYGYLGDTKKAIKHYAHALKIAIEIKDRNLEGRWLGNLGNSYSDLKKFSKAIECYDKALKIAIELDDEVSKGLRLGNLGTAYCDLGEYKKAINYYEQGLKIAIENKDKRAEGAWLGNLGDAYHNLNDDKKAVEYFRKSLVIGKAIEDPKIINFVEPILKEIEECDK